MAQATLAFVSLTRAEPDLVFIAGSPGCGLAKRLTEDHETSVLLLEAGGNDDAPEIHNLSAAVALFHSAVDWDYPAKEEPHINNRKIHWSRGKVLGGSKFNELHGICSR